jgi:hypothetical protein
MVIIRKLLNNTANAVTRPRCLTACAGGRYEKCGGPGVTRTIWGVRIAGSLGPDGDPEELYEVIAGLACW